MAQEAPQSSTGREWRNAIRVRLFLAGLVLAGAIIAFNALDSGAPVTEPPVASPASREPEIPPTPAASPAITPASGPSESAGEARPPEGVEPFGAKEPPAARETAPAGPEPTREATSTAHSEGIIRTLQSADASEAAPPAGAAPRPAPKLPSGPYLQVGVFNHPANAAELKAKLEAQGIPVFIATRVQVGPFKDRREAEAMREKLKAMGMASVLISQ